MRWSDCVLEFVVRRIWWNKWNRETTIKNECDSRYSETIWNRCMVVRHSISVVLSLSTRSLTTWKKKWQIKFVSFILSTRWQVEHVIRPRTIWTGVRARPLYPFASAHWFGLPSHSHWLYFFRANMWRMTAVNMVKPSGRREKMVVRARWNAKS